MKVQEINQAVSKVEEWKKSLSDLQNHQKSGALLKERGFKVEQASLEWLDISKIIGFLELIIAILLNAKDIFQKKEGELKKPGFLGLMTWVRAGKFLWDTVKDITGFLSP